MLPIMIEQGTETSDFVEFRFKDIDAALIHGFLPHWRGGTQESIGTIFQHDTDGHFDLSLHFLQDQGDIWIRDQTVGGRRGKPVLDEDYYHLGDVETVMLYRDEGAVTFFTKDKRGKVEISNRGKTIVYQNHRNRSNKVVTVDLL